MINLLDKYPILMKIRELLKFGKGLDKNKLILLGAGCVLLVYLDIFFIIKTQVKAIRSVESKIIKLEKGLNTLGKDLIIMQDLERKRSAAGKDRQMPRAKKFISEEAMPLLLQDISDMANRNSVKIAQVKPSKDIQRKEEAALGKNLLPITITLDLSCGYHSLGSFISSLENAPQFITVQEMSIRANANDYLYQKINLILKTYAKK